MMTSNINGISADVRTNGEKLETVQSFSRSRRSKRRIQTTNTPWLSSDNCSANETEVSSDNCSANKTEVSSDICSADKTEVTIVQTTAALTRLTLVQTTAALTRLTLVQTTAALTRLKLVQTTAPLTRLTLVQIVELLGPNFQQKFAFGGRSLKFGVEILLTMPYLNIDRSKIV